MSQMAKFGLLVAVYVGFTGIFTFAYWVCEKPADWRNCVHFAVDTSAFRHRLLEDAIVPQGAAKQATKLVSDLHATLAFVAFLVYLPSFFGKDEK